ASRGVDTLRGYAIGDKNFSTATLVATIVATFASGEYFFTIVSEAYASGIGFIYTALVGEVLSLFLIGRLFAPRMAEFLGSLSIAEAMGGLYGNNVRIITSISGFIGVAGIIAVQLKIAGILFEYALGLEPTYGVISAGILITFYSSLGGIKSVTLTDIVQFATFGVVIPVISYYLLGSIENNQVIIDTLTTNPVFDYNTIFSFSNPQIYYYITLFVWCVIPSFDPAIFQRVAMARDTKQVGSSFLMSCFVCMLLIAILSWIGILVLSSHPNMPENEIFKFILTNSNSFMGFKGVILIGIMAMVMSTVDSYINSSAVLIAHDLRQSLNIPFIKNELLATRIGSMLIGSVSILFAMRQGSFIELFIWASMFYMPVVSVPFILAILGFRSSTKAVLIGMGSGLFTAIVWESFFKLNGVGGLVPGILANITFLFASHYLLNQKGGWVGIKDPRPLLEQKEERRQQYKKLWQGIKSFNFIEVCTRNTPKGDGIIFFLGLFVMISTFASVTTITKEAQEHYAYLLDVFYPIVLCSTSALMSYPLWLPVWRQTNSLSIIWNCIMFFGLICFSFLMVLISEFWEIQLMVFMANIMLISTLVSWRWALFTLTTGVLTTLFLFKTYALTYILTSTNAQPLEFKIIYLLLMLSSLLVIFLKPKQEYVEATEHKVEELEVVVNDLDKTVIHYSQRVADQAMEIERLGATAQKILNNVNHELRLPVGNVMNFAEMLSGGLETYSKAQLKMLSDEVFTNSNRLSTMILNMLDLSMLSTSKIELQKKMVNLSELVEDRVNNCRKVYLQGKEIDFEMSIEPDILIAVDPNYIRQTVDNLVINAITYSQKGTIKVSLLRKGNNIVEFVIKDEGIGIPKSELFDIFTPFKMGTKTESKAEGRGVGLALCKAAVEAHDGVIKVESGGDIGAKFTFVLSLK
ncbi:MAG: hypothetical protein H0U78_03165, partial [Rickettsiaceae bacterium]|nr:hypothetical protein [Rickettsiaceae bacterium]